MTDPVGDTGRSTPDLLVPDLRSGSIEITSGNLMVISVRCAPGTFDPAITHFQIELDTDQNPGTGNVFFGLGLEYIVNLGSAYYAAGAEVSRHIGDGQYVRVSTIPVTVVADGMDVAIPLALVGNDDGRLNFRVTAGSYLGGNAFTAILDFMPDRDAPGAVVQ